jgi:hypothetical protein
MKLKIFRQSGNPVALEDRENYDREFKAIYDKCAERAKLDMLKLNRMVAFCERQLCKKWNKTIEIEIPRSKKGMIKLLSQYENIPIMLAATTDGKDIVAILMDQLQ